MELEGKVAVVTGGAGGIGSALARRFHAGGVKAVVVLDRDGEGAQAVAGPLEAERPGSAARRGVRRVRRVRGRRAARSRRGHVRPGGPVLRQRRRRHRHRPRDARRRLAHRARRQLHGAPLRGTRASCPGGSSGATATSSPRPRPPGCSPRSAPGRTPCPSTPPWPSPNGSRSPTATSGLKVSCLCPMGVNTAMLNPPGGGGRRHRGAGRQRGEGGRRRARARRRSPRSSCRPSPTRRFLILPHPEVLTFFQRKASDYDRWLAGMRRLQARVAAG